MIDRVGRLVLIKSVIMARAINQLLITDAPTWLLDEIVKWVRAFFWDGKRNNRGAMLSLQG
jgi:hypothetical protein